MTRYPQRVRVVEPGLHPRVLKGAVALSAGVVGVPLHAQIFAWSTGRPLLGLSFEEKSDAFLAEVGADMVPLAVVDARKIVAWMEGL
jgi:polysaccharide pyruvyl transferase WcaK-like protein